MRTGIHRLTGLVILIGATLGLVLSFSGLYAVWTMKPVVTQNAQELLSLARRTLDATEGMLAVIGTSLDQAGQDLKLMRSMLQDTGATIGQSTSMLDKTASIIGETLPEFLSDTQTSLESTQKTARLIDDILTTLSNIPFIGGSLSSRYLPDMPLNESIAQVSLSIQPLGDSLTTIQSDMKTASATMATIQGEIEALSRQIEDIETSLQAAKKEVAAYKLILADVRDRLNKMQQRLPVVIDTVSLGMMVILSWVGISQLGALLHAAELLTRQANHDLLE